MATRAILFIFNVLFAVVTVAQQNNIWYFGDQAGMDFNTDPPTAITSPLVSNEGTACMSDANGDLLFFTDGVTIWDRTHTVMPNGSGLLGGISSTQSALIVPMPGSCNLYWVFTVQDHNDPTGILSYSIVDMCLNGGFGDVVVGQKNVFLESPCGEKLTAVPHANGKDMWIIAHRMGNNDFLSYQLTETGFLPPVVSSVGSNHMGTAVIGPVKASHDGTRVVTALTFGGVAEMFDFDDLTGLLSNPLDLISTYSLGVGVYGMEFSPNDSLLYVTTYWGGVSNLYQLDVYSAGSIILASMGGVYNYCALQMGPDTNIYVARNLGYSYVDVIEDPDVMGVGCNLTSPGITFLPGTFSNFGFPNFIPAFYGSSPTYSLIDLGNDTTSCTPIELYPGGDCVASYLWQDGSTDSTFTVTTTGTYYVEMTNLCGTGSDTIDVTISIPAPIVADLGNDTNICASGTLELIGGADSLNYVWQDGSTDSSFTATGPGTYWVQISDDCSSDTDTIVVGTLPSISVDLGNDTTVCTGGTFDLIAGPGTYSYLWQDGSTDTSYTVTGSGTYYVDMTDLCGTVSDTIVVNYYSSAPFTIDLGPDTTICVGDTLVLTAGLDTLNYLWNSGSTDSAIVVNAQGMYWVDASDVCVTESDTIMVTIIPPMFLELGPDTALCPGDSLVLIAGTNASNYLWQDGSTDSSFVVSAAGFYWVSASDQCNAESDSINVTIAIPIDVEIGSDTTICYDDSLTLVSNSTIPNYLWQNGSTDTLLYAAMTGWYWLQSSDHCSTDTDSLYLTVIPESNPILTTETDICYGDTVFLNAGAGMWNYSWHDGSTDSTYLAFLPGTYSVSGLTVSGCPYASSVTLDLCIDCEDSLVVPNVFTPNGDGHNDIFYIDPGDVSDFKLQIYNRWGQLLFENDDRYVFWDGTTPDSEEAPSGAYFYVITYLECLTAEFVELSGHVTLLR